MRKYLLGSLIFLILCLFIVFLNNYPTYHASQKVPSGYVYSGHAAWFDPWDLNVYLSSIKYGQKHGLLLKNLYTTNDNKPIIMYPIYTLVGSLFPKNDIFQLYYTLRYVTILLVVISILYSSFIFLKDIRLSFATIFLITLSRGYGWVLINQLQSPDLFMTGFSFRSTFQRTHEAIGMSFYILAFTFLYSYLITDRHKYYFLFLLFSVFQIFFYPYYYVNYLLTFIFFIIYRKKTINKIVPLIISISLLGILSLVYFIAIKDSGFSSDLAEQQPLITPIGLLSGYGMYIIIFIYQLLNLKHNKANSPLVFTIIWMLISLTLSYIPLGFNRFFLRGLYFPLTIIALITLQYLVRQKKITILLLSFFIGLYLFTTIPSTIYIFYKRVNEANLTNNINGWYFLPKDYSEAFQFLDKLPNDGILSDYWVGNHIPVYTNKSVYLGHLIQTPNAQERKKQIQNLFANKYNPKTAKDLLVKNNIHYIFYGIQEKQYGKTNYDFLRPIFTNDKVTIFQVVY